MGNVSQVLAANEVIDGHTASSKESVDDAAFCQMLDDMATDGVMYAGCRNDQNF